MLIRIHIIFTLTQSSSFDGTSFFNAKSKAEENVWTVTVILFYLRSEMKQLEFTSKAVRYSWCLITATIISLDKIR
jgi:hypothetical protein